MTGEWKFSTLNAEEIFLSLLARRDALRVEPAYDPDDPAFLDKHGLSDRWINHGHSAYDWKVRSPFALLLCGLLARASDQDVDPLSIQASSGAFGYNAAGLWKDVIVKNASERISLRKLKNAPFNNSPFNGKRRLATDWSNTTARSKKTLKELFDMLTEIAESRSSEAESALLAVLLVAPDPPRLPAADQFGLGDSYPEQLPSIVEFADAVQNFISLNSDDGRRAQAFVTACLEVALPERIMTPASVNDPSRRSPGDVKSLLSSKSRDAGPLFVEVKDKLVRKPDVEQFIREVESYDKQSSAGYAALANARDEGVIPPNDMISGEKLTESMGIPVVVWRSPLDLLTQATTWSGFPSSKVVWLCAHNYLKWLSHMDTGKNDSPADWKARLAGWGFFDGELAD